MFSAGVGAVGGRGVVCILTVKYSEPSLQRQNMLFPRILPFKSICCCKQSLISRVICKKNLDLLAHLSRRLKVSYCDHSASVVVVRLSVRPSVRPQSLNNILATDWILTNLHRNDPCLVLFQSCTNGFGLLHI